MSGLVRQGHFLGPKLRTLRKRNGLTLEELSARCVQTDASNAPSVSYLSMVETGKRVPSKDMLELLAGIFGKDPRWFLDENTEITATQPRRVRGAVSAMPLEPAFLFSRELLQNALPELLAQTGTSGRQFAQLLIRVWQETHQNDFPDIERAAEAAGQRMMPISREALLDICRRHGLQVRWADIDKRRPGTKLLRARFEAPGTIVINRQLKDQEERLKYELAFFLGHKILHNGDGVISPHSIVGVVEDELGDGSHSSMGAQDVLYAWRDFECSVFAGALLCPRVPFRQFLVRESHSVFACRKLGVTPAVVMRRMTAVSPYRHWHFFDGYQPGYLRAVYRGNGIALPWGNMSLVPDPCPRWAVFRLLGNRAGSGNGVDQINPDLINDHQAPTSQISIMHDGEQLQLYCCHSLLTRDAADTMHVLSVGVDLAPALEAQGFDAEATIQAVNEACRRGGGEGPIPADVAERIRTVSHVLNISWISDALASPASVICPRSRNCPRTTPCTGERR